MLFDLGGVLVRFVGLEKLGESLATSRARGQPLALEELYGRWLSSPSVRAFERGRTDIETFASGVIGEFGLAIRPDQFAAEVLEWIPGLLPGALELLDDLEGRVTRACLSNTNGLHWPRMQSYGLSVGRGARLEHSFLSFELGMVKPDREIFEHVCQALELAPGRILFFDDAALNVEAARAAGLRAERVESPAACRARLEALLSDDRSYLV